MKTFVLLGSCLLAGCGGMIATMSGVTYARDPADYDDIYRKISAEYDQHRAVTSYTGPTVYARQNVFDDWYLLRSYVYDSGTTATQIYISVRVDSWAFIDRAYSRGRELPLLEIDREVVSCSGGAYSGCSLAEDVAITLSDDDLATYSKTGLEFQVYGNDGSAEFSIPPGYFRAMQDRLLMGLSPSQG